MKIFKDNEAKKMRQTYIENFVNTKHEFYSEQILKMLPYADGMYHESGYLWEFFKNPVVITGEQCLEKLKRYNSFYVMWDLNQFVRSWTTDIPGWLKAKKWEYPRDAILLFSEDELLTDCQALPWDDYIYFDKKNVQKGKHIISNLPWDLYVFDNSFKWTVAFTHETNLNGTKFYLLNEVCDTL